MIGLILETATEAAGIVLTENGQVKNFTPLSGGKELANLFAHEVHSILKKENIQPHFIATGIGPGSYTGIRVGASLAQGLSLGWNIPLIGFCNLISFCPQIDFEGAVVFDAKMGGLYLFSPKTEKKEKISWTDAQEKLKNYSQIATPHFDSIREKAPFLEEKLIKTFINPKLLALFCHKQMEEKSLAPFCIQY